MALTYKDIIEGAERIRTNELPESNTADLVGQQLKNMAEFFLSASSDIPELRTYLLQRLQGTAADSDALRDPLKWLGSVEDDGGLNTLLDGLHAKGVSEGKAKAGFFRGDYEGSPFMVENIPMAYDTDTWVQSVRGRFMPMEGAETGLTRSSDAYGILWRSCENGVWGRWKSVGGGVGRPAEGVTGGEIFNDYENNTVSGDYAHAEGQGCSANGDASHAEGKGTDVEGHYGHAEGLRTIVENDCEHAEGCYNVSNTGTRHSIGIGTSESDRRNALEVMDDGRVYVKGVGGYDGVLDEEADRPLQDVLEEALSASEYAAFDFGVLQEKIGSGRTQGDLDAFGLTAEVWAKIRGAEIMVVRDDAHERTYVVTGSSDDYISFAYGMKEDYEGWEIAYSGDTYTIARHFTEGGGESGGGSSPERFETSLDGAVRMPSAVGGLKAGTTVSSLKGRTQNAILESMLFPEQQPTVQSPSASLSLKNGFTANGIYEVGADAPGADDFTTGFNRGTCTVSGQADKYRAGALDAEKSFIYTGGSESNKTLPEKVTLGTMQYNYKAFFGEGDTLVTSQGNKASVIPNPLPAASVSSGAVYIYGTYPYFCNGQKASTSSQESGFPSSVTSGTKLLQKWTDTLVGAKFASEASTGTRLVFEFPVTKEVTKVEFMNTVSGKWEVFAEGNYAVSSSGNKNIQGSYIMYNKLTTEGALNGALQLRFTLADASSRMMAEGVADGLSPLPEGGVVALASRGGRAQGVASFAVNFEPGGQAPLDARLLVPTKADLVKAGTYAAGNYYKGMMVVVADTLEVYVLKDTSKITSPDYSGWQMLGTSGTGNAPIVIQ